MGNLKLPSPFFPNGVVSDRPASRSPSSPPPLLASIGGDSWAIAERATHEIVAKMQPTLTSMQERLEVIDYVQRLIGGCLGSEVDLSLSPPSPCLCNSSNFRAFLRVIFNLYSFNINYFINCVSCFWAIKLTCLSTLFLWCEEDKGLILQCA